MTNAERPSAASAEQRLLRLRERADRRRGSPQSIAMGKVKWAIKAGRLVRPAACSNCGDTPPPTAAGYSRIQAHHHAGYDQPLDVQWLCAACHRAVTPLPKVMGATVRGERAGLAKLTEQIVREIRTSQIRSGLLAQRYSVSRTLIKLVRAGKIWRHVNV